MRRPPQTAFDSDPIVTTVGSSAAVGAFGRGVEAEVDERLVDDDDGAGLVGDAQHVAPVLLGHQGARRVVEVGDEVGQTRRRLSQRRLELGDLPAAAGIHRDRDEARVVGPDGVEGSGIAGQFGEDPIARSGEQAQQQVERVQRAAGDDDLVGVRRHAALGEAGGDRGAQIGQAHRVVAVAGRDLGQPGGGVGDGLGQDAGRRRQRGAGKIDDVVRMRGDVPAREVGPRALRRPGS